jgi:preprotein translocase SecE subunit
MPLTIEKEMEQAVQRPPTSLPGASLIGTLYLALGLGALQYLLPWVWQEYVAPNLALAALVKAILLVLLVGAGLGALIYFYPRVVPPTEGARAGVAAGMIFLILGFLVVYLSCLFLDGVFTLLKDRGALSRDFHATRYYAGAPVAALLALLWLRWGWRLLKRASVQKFLCGVEAQGWFQTGAYKPNQGRLIRRLTMLGILALVAAGFYHFWPAIQRGMTGVWAWTMPFTDDYNLVLAHMPGLTITTIIALGALWLSYRAVNAHRFADFLIATSAEMQKVSWSTRKQVTRDTIVVLVVTAILSAYLLAMDLIWVVVLRFFGVLKH